MKKEFLIEPQMELLNPFDFFVKNLEKDKLSKSKRVDGTGPPRDQVIARIDRDIERIREINALYYPLVWPVIQELGVRYYCAEKFESWKREGGEKGIFYKTKSTKEDATRLMIEQGKALLTAFKSLPPVSVNGGKSASTELSLAVHVSENLVYWRWSAHFHVD